MGAVLSSNLPLATSISSLVQDAVDAAAPDSDNVSAIGMRWSMPETTTEKRDNLKKVQPESGADDLSRAIDDLKFAIEQFEINNKQESK